MLKVIYIVTYLYEGSSLLFDKLWQKNSKVMYVQEKEDFFADKMCRLLSSKFLLLLNKRIKIKISNYTLFSLYFVEKNLH